MIFSDDGLVLFFFHSLIVLGRIPVFSENSLCVMESCDSRSNILSLIVIVMQKKIINNLCGLNSPQLSADKPSEARANTQQLAAGSFIQRFIKICDFGIVLDFIVLSVLSGLICSFIVLPGILGLRGAKMEYVSFSHLLEMDLRIPLHWLFYSFLPGAFKGEWLGSVQPPLLYCGMIPLVLVIASILSAIAQNFIARNGIAKSDYAKTILKKSEETPTNRPSFKDGREHSRELSGPTSDIRDKKYNKCCFANIFFRQAFGYGLLLLILLASMVLVGPYQFWHGAAYPAGFETRFAFIYVFFLLQAANQFVMWVEASPDSIEENAQKTSQQNVGSTLINQFCCNDSIHISPKFITKKTCIRSNWFNR